MTHLNPIQRNALVLAGALSAFTLVLIGAVASRVMQDSALDAAAPTVAAPTSAPATAGPDPAVQALIDAREAGYKSMIQQANDRLSQANSRLKMAYAVAAPVDLPSAARQPAYLAADRAAQLALAVAPGASVVRTPELVNFQGTAAYEVTLDAGTVYMDAVSGQVLFSGVAAMVASSGGGGGGGRNGGASDSGEREGRDGGDDEGDDDGEHEAREAREHDDEDRDHGDDDRDDDDD